MAAPVIVLGRVLEVDEIGQPKPSSGDRRIRTELTKIKIDIQTVVKGSVRSNPIEFYYFTYSSAGSEIDLGAPRYLPEIGQRRIYFLKPYKTSYRSVGDVTDYTLRVSSGNHSGMFCEGRGPGCCIAEILLVPQQGVDGKWFVIDLTTSEYVAEVLCSRRTAQDLMQKLLQYPDQKLSDAAREVIAGTRSSR